MNDFDTLREYAEAERERANRAEAKLRAARALADEWEATFRRWSGVSDASRVGIFRAHANRLRAVLDGGA